jgi:hypothetical protein
MDGTSGDQKLFSDRRVTNLPGDLKFHLAFQDDDQFVGGMSEVLPSASWRVGPEVATEPSLRPIGSNPFTVDLDHLTISLNEFRQTRELPTVSIISSI